MVGTQAAGAHDQEARQIDAQLRDLEIRLIEEYRRRGDGCAARVQRTLEAHRQRFADARVRTFLPILIERATRAELAAGPGC